MTWKKGILKDLVDLQRGYDLPSQYRKPGNIPVMGGGGMNGYHAVSSNRGPGVVIGRSGAGFGSAYYSETDFWAHNTVLFVKDFKGNNPKYVFHFLKYLDFSKYNSGGAQPSLNRNFIYPIEIEIPPYPEQTVIVHILDKWDLSIEKTEQLIAAKEKRYSWFIRAMVDDMCGSWEHRRADKIFKNISEKRNGGAELLSVTQDRGVIPRSMLEGRVMSPEGGTDSYKLIKEGDFAISLRSFQGGIEYSRFQGLISPAYTVLRPMVQLHNDFYRHFFKSYLFIEKYLSIAVIGIRDGKQISIPDFMTVKIPFPPIDQQKQIATILNTARQEIDLLKKQAEAFRTQKRGLMQKLLTGEWRVRVG